MGKGYDCSGVAVAYLTGIDKLFLGFFGFIPRPAIRAGSRLRDETKRQMTHAHAAIWGAFGIRTAIGAACAGSTFWMTPAKLRAL